MLERTAAAWDELVDIERDIDSWRLEDQIVFIEEWSLEEDRLQRLADLVQVGALTGDQRSRYEQLLKLVKQRRPIIERLLRS
jgi:hypothetical protein